MLLWLVMILQVETPVDPKIEFGPIPEWVELYALNPSVEPRSDRHANGMVELLLEYQEEARTENLFIRRMYRIENVAGLQNGAQISMDFDPLHQQLVVHTAVLHREGHRIQALEPGDWKLIQRETELDRFMYDGTFSAVGFLDGLQVGDTVEYAFTIIRKKTKFGEKFWSKFPLNFPYSLNVYHLRIVAPEEMVLQRQSDLNGFEPTIETHAGQTVYRWLADGKDRSAPVWDPDKEKHGAYVTITAYKNWYDVVRQLSPYYKLSNQAPWLDSWLQKTEEKFPELEDQVMEAIRFVQDDIRYLGIEMGSSSHIPSPPEETFKRRFGDCKDKTQLLCQILRQLGVPANAVLVHSKRGQALETKLPSPFEFDHVVTMLVWEEETFGIDATASHERGRLAERGGLPFGKGLVLNHRDKQLIDLPKQLGIFSVREARQFNLSKWGKTATFSIETTYRGAWANRRRSEFETQSLRVMSESYFKFRKGEFPDLEMVGLMKVEDFARDNRFVTTEDYRIPSYGTGDARNFFVAYGHGIQRFLDWPDQENAAWAPDFPLELSVEYQVTLPDAWPYSGQRVRVDNAVFSYEFEGVHQGGKNYVFNWHFQSHQNHTKGVEEDLYLADLAMLRKTDHSVLSVWGGDGDGFGKAFLRFNFLRLDTLFSLLIFGGAFLFYVRVYRAYRRREWAHWRDGGQAS